MIPEIDICNFRRDDVALGNGSRIIATFDVQFRDFACRLHGLQLRREMTGNLRVNLPATRIHGKEGRVRAMSFGRLMADAVISEVSKITEVPSAPNDKIYR